LERILAGLTHDLLPGVTHWSHPRFFAYVPQSATPPSIAADVVISALNVNGLLWQTSPAVAELEAVVLGWLARLLGIPAGWFGQTQESASLAILTALTVARERDRREHPARRGRVVCSSETHASAHKAARLLDLPITILDADDEGRLCPDRLARELAAGDVCAVVATIGTTSRAAVDPLARIAPLCRAAGAWLHVDGAYASAAAICPEHAHILDGIPLADSFVVNAHKWLGATAACTCLYVADRDALHDTFATDPDYLDKDEQLVNLVDYGPMFSHRLAALKLWFSLRAHGAEGLRAGIRRAIDLAGGLAAAIEEDPDWELRSYNFSVVCFRLQRSDEDNLALLRAVNADGRIFISRTRVEGRFALRLAIGSGTTTREDVALAWDVLREHAALAALEAEAVG
jgi:aromatic-L-amino-acid decarboxylase